jgi:hypothetical protein
MAMRVVMTIERAIAWAVRDELPKVQALAGLAHAPNGCVTGSGLKGVLALGTRIDHVPVNDYGVVALAGEHGRCDDDALRIGHALLALDAMARDMAGQMVAGLGEWDAFEDLAALDACAIAGPLLAQARSDARARAAMAARLMAAPSEMMIRAAVLGPPRGWALDAVRPEVVRASNGRPAWFRRERRAVAWTEDGEPTAWDDVEVNGFNARAQRPHGDAYQRHVLTPDPLAVAIARAEWQLWRAALDLLHEELDGRLARITLLPSAQPWRPWVEGQAASARVLHGPALPAATGQRGRIRSRAKGY